MEKNFIKTSDLSLASTILCYGYDVIGIDASNPNRITFFFDEIPDIRQLIEDFWANKLSVNPLELHNSRRELLSRINEAKNQ